MTLSLVDYDKSLDSMIRDGPITELPEVVVPVLGKMVGVYSKLDAKSTNRRWYSSEFWTKVINSQVVKQDLKRGMIGTFEHPTTREIFSKLTGSNTSSHPLSGSHVTKKLWIEGKNLLGESYILNNPSGRALATYLLAKDDEGNPLVELYISARGGSKKDYFKPDGLDHMNPNDYVLSAFDVTVNPGIKGTRVKMESEDSPTEYLNPWIQKVESKVDEINQKFDEKKSVLISLLSELNLKSSIKEGVSYD